MRGDHARDELWRLLHQAQCSRAYAHELGSLANALWPEWAATVNFDQRNPHHLYPLDQHLLTAAGLGNTPILRLTGLLHDIAKPQTITITDGVGHFYGHARAGAALVRQMLARVNFDQDTIEHVATLVEWHMFPWDDAGPKAIRRVMRAVGPTLVDELLTLRRMDTLASGIGDWSGESDVRARVAALFAENLTSRLALSGRDIMEWLHLDPGPHIGAILREVQNWVDEDAVLRNERTALEAYVRSIPLQPSHE